MNETVLILDDSLTVRMDLAELFEASGFRPIPCATVAAARGVLEREQVIVAVLDVHLPDGNGVDFLHDLRASNRGAEIVVLMLSSAAEVEDRLRGLQTGADEYIGKPYDAGYVVAKTRELLRARAGTASSERRPTILIIDDSVTYRQALRAAVERVGYTALITATGEDGLRIASDQRPTAILVDGALPGIDGATVIRHIRLDLALRGTPCLLLTASDDHGAELAALDAGADAFIRKEEPMEVVLAKLSAALRRVPTTSADAISLRGPRRILAIDDSETFLRAIAEMLREDGYDVVMARSGEEALALLAVQLVDCILLDLLMPGIGGKETCRRIKAAPVVRDIPLIMLTALEDRRAMVEGLGAGADDYLSKSSDFEVIKARVRAQIRRKQFEDENRGIREALLRKEVEAADARAAQRVAEARALLVDELEWRNRELDAFSYSVSHDLRAPLRSIAGFSHVLLEDYGPALDDKGREHLQRIEAAAGRMGELIDDLLEFSRVSRAQPARTHVDLSALVRVIATELAQANPGRSVAIDIQGGLEVNADPRLIRIVLENLLGNAWKFTGRVDRPSIAFGRTEIAGEAAYFVRDNGSGFSMAYAEKLFQPFQRLHSDADFPGTGIGLATIQRVIERHGGRVWADAAVNSGATFFFTVPE